MLEECRTVNLAPGFTFKHKIAESLTSSIHIAAETEF